MKIYSRIVKWIDLIKHFQQEYFHLLFLDSVYYLIMLFTGSFYIYRILPQFLHILDVADLLRAGKYATTDSLMTSIDAMTIQLANFKIWSVVILLILFANYSIFKYLIWNRIFKIQEKPKTLCKNIGIFAVLNMIIAMKIVLALILSYYFFTPEFFNIVFFMIVPLAAIYTINLLHPLFVKEKNILKAYRLFFVYGIQQFYRFIVPYTIMIICFIIVMQYVLPFFLFLPDFAYVLLYVAGFAAYFNLTKYYILAVVQKCK